MSPLLTYTRRPDISFNRNGTIRLSARVVRLLSIMPGDSINISVCNAEHLLYVIRHSDSKAGERFEAQCHPTKRGGNNFYANSVRLCRALLSSVSVSAPKVSFAVGDPQFHFGSLYLPILTRMPL